MTTHLEDLQFAVHSTMEALKEERAEKAQLLLTLDETEDEIDALLIELKQQEQELADYEAQVNKT